MPWKKKLLHIFLWFAGSLIVAAIYGTLFENIFGSPKERLLSQQVENLKLQYTLIGRELDNSLESLRQFKAL